MTVELISVGTEILLGNIVNTNAAYLAEQCAVLGLSCFYQTVVGDNEARLAQVLETALGRSDIIILSGGLGPTRDDLTKETAARVMGKELHMDEHSRKRIEDFFTKRGLELTDNNWKQAMVPEGAVVIDNDNGTAPGIIIESEEKRVILLPGPPGELIPMFESAIYPYLSKAEPGVIYSQTVKLCGIGESKAETMVADLIAEQGNPTIAPYAKIGEVHLRITAKASAEKEAKKLIKPVVKELKNRFGMNVYTTEENVTLEQAVVDLLLANKLTVTTAESCTAGLLAGRIMNVAGATQIYNEGYITYSNEAKEKLVGVSHGTLESHGAVSHETAAEMAEGAARAAGADASVSVTGIAGPDGGTKEKPVGLVYVGCYVKGNVRTEEFRFLGNRAKNREYAVVRALTLLREELLKA